MARGRDAQRPGALPPETRTVGQLVAESLRLYGRRFWVCLPLGLSLAAVNQLAGPLPRAWQLVLASTAGGLLLTASFVAASAIVAGGRPTARTLATAFCAGVLAFLPAPPLAIFFVLPALAYLAFVGLVVPVAVIERTGLRASFARAAVLARADYVHALGSLATLALVYFLSRTALLFLLRGQADATLRVALFLADLVISPLLFLGAALLYFDQQARVVSSRPRRKRSSDADLHHAVEPDRAGHSDAEVEPRPAARGQS